MPGAEKPRGVALHETMLAAAVIGLLLLFACSAVPIVRDVPKPVRSVVERAGCDEAAKQIGSDAARTSFLASCYAAADLFGLHAKAHDAGAE